MSQSETSARPSETNTPRRRAPFSCGYCGRSYLLPRPRACCSKGREWDIKMIASQKGIHMADETVVGSSKDVVRWRHRPEHGDIIRSAWGDFVRYDDIKHLLPTDETGEPYLHDRATGVHGVYCIARVVNGTTEYWTGKHWAAFCNDMYFDLRPALKAGGVLGSEK